MFSKFEFLTAFRYLRSKKERTFSVITTFSLMGIMLGVAAIIVVMSVMNGFREELVSKIIGISGHVVVRKDAGKDVENYKVLQDAVVKTIASDKAPKAEIQRILPVVEGQVVFSNAGRTVGGLVKGTNLPKMFEEPLLMKKYEGKKISEVAGNEIVVGYALARNLNLKIGDNLTFISPNGNSTAFGTFPKIQAFKIAGTFNIGMYQYDSNFAFMPLETSQTFFNKAPDSASYVEVFLDSPNEADWGKKVLNDVLYINYLTLSWKDINSTYYNALKVERNVMFLILTLIIIVAAFNIISSLVMLVKDKKSDIAVFRTIGASRRSVVKIFFLTGSFIGVVGTFTGVLLGLLISYNLNWIKGVVEKITGTEMFAEEIYFLSSLPSKVMLNDVVYVVALSLGISLIATLIPSFSAAKTEPVEALKYE